ncbi:YbaK/EbsC family protein [Hamadaea tsunoensis]|uniref:YbaK/EbsC family protein n=1 Tax=Hamadaea tsunoensis TaxID=53368 RepID=UPI000429D192|nr:YbaK/EbsC family protein [Hamadaea tsunoensis]
MHDHPAHSVVALDGTPSRATGGPDRPTGTYGRIIDLLDTSGARYRLIEHGPEGRTEAASLLRDNPLAKAAKCIVIRVSLTKKGRRYVLAVVPGDRKVDLDEVSRVVGGTKAAFASREVAERMSGSVSGSIPPLSFHPELDLIVDESLLKLDEFFFNAARLDRSVALAVDDYLVLARPRVERIAA